jgi:cytochrome c
MKKIALAFSALVLCSSAAMAQNAAPDAAAGKALWEGNNTQCKNCHGRAGEGGFGPDLAGRGLSAAQFTQAVRKPWGVMPMFIPSQVSDSELADVAAYFAGLPKNTAPAPWRVPVDPAAPLGQQMMVAVGCGQCHGANFDGRTTLGAINADFELLKSIVYTHTDTMPKVDEDLAAARAAALGAPPAPPAGAAPAGGPPRRLRMGNFIPLRVSEAQLREIYDWSKDEIGFRPALQARFTPAAAGSPTYNLLLANTGVAGKGVVAQGLVVDLTIPAGVTVASATGSGYKGVHKDATSGADVAEWQIARLAPKDSQNLSVTLTAAPATATGLRGTVHWAKPGPKSGPGVDQVNFGLPGAGGGRGG